MSFLELRNVSKKYESDCFALQEVSLEVEEGEFLCIVGPSGCGKSTLLRLVSGLEQPSSGSIKILGDDLSSITPLKRNIGMVFQDYALYPHMSVYSNLAYPLKIRKIDKNEIETKVKETAQMLKIEEFLHRKPSQLSGGQKQRVAIGRAIIRNPALILMDEPLSDLDAKLRMEMREEIYRLHSLTKSTILYVTHDQEEAAALSDNVVVLNEGVVQQISSYPYLYSHPKNKFVAEFIGSPTINELDVQSIIDCPGVFLPSSFSRFLLNMHNSLDGVVIAFRPETVGVNIGSVNDVIKLQATVNRSENYGSKTVLFFDFQGNTLVSQLNDNSLGLRAGNTVYLSIDINDVLCFDKLGSLL